jgi:hypothetical protein
MFIFDKILFNDIDDKEFNDFPKKTIFTTKDWLRFIENDQGAKIIIIRIRNDDEIIGFFSGGIVSKYGIKIVGSPFRGWSTCFMGLDIKPKWETVKIELYKRLKDYLISQYKCQFIEITDRNLTFEEASKITTYVKNAKTLELDIDRPIEEIFKEFKTDCRNFIRQFERRGASLEIAEPTETFAEEYYEQLIEVFAKQGLVPTYSLEKVKTLVNALKDTTNILCLKIIDPNGKNIASSIFLGYGQKFFFWGGASFRNGQMYRPNEYMIWFAINYWKKEGYKVFDMVGIREYKKKFSPKEIIYPRIIFAKYKQLVFFRDLAERSYYRIITIKGFFVKKPKPPIKYSDL